MASSSTPEAPHWRRLTFAVPAPSQSIPVPASVPTAYVVSNAASCDGSAAGSVVSPTASAAFHHAPSSLFATRYLLSALPCPRKSGTTWVVVGVANHLFDTADVLMV